MPAAGDPAHTGAVLALDLVEPEPEPEPELRERALMGQGSGRLLAAV